MLYITKNYGLFIGELNTNSFHKHYAIQISVSLNEKMHLENKLNETLKGYFIYIPSNIDHKLLSGKTQLTILINPLSPLGHQLFLKLGKSIESEPNIKLKDQLIQLLTLFQSNMINNSQFTSSLEEILDLFKCECAESNHAEDDRIIKTLEFFDNHFEKVYSLEEIAAKNHLSPSRFLHLFKEKTGLNFRRYQLWNKTIKSLPFLKTHSITETAHTFGFTDSSHYARTVKETFGVSPKFFLTSI